ncbi:xylulokinase [Acetobacter sacchari]|uniref:Xylulose kinase n=1 Tax=Acetobacter sacchari TaxID=2661687 RepID=A0ABS3LR19_9PROT|nr:xylulokinase [Acetobacter sacchari]MBO1358359.1 xylulokinase [Acetobacter sacchari]
MYIGLDLGTSGVKAIIVDDEQAVVATRTEPLTVSRPRPGWSEQYPEAWWTATQAALAALRREAPEAMAKVRGLGLSGQQHGAVLLGANGEVLRPCILWNDTRSTEECAEFERRFPESRSVCANIAMPGFTAPKLIWVARHEPEIFAATRHVLLPKAWLRYRLTGEMIEDMSDASGSLWLDVGARRWSDEALAACELRETAMPALFEGNAPAGRVKADLAREWGMTDQPVVAGGAGDNAGGAVGLGAIRSGNSFLSLGTSGVLWTTTDGLRVGTERGVHAFCHAVPDMWHQMGVTMSAAASLAWWSRVCGIDEPDLLAELPERIEEPSKAVFLPYLSGERTPHNDADIRGGFLGLSQDSDRAAMTQAVLEGVAFSFRDALDGLRASGSVVSEADVIGGGSRSPRWVRILAAALDIPLHRLKNGELGGSFGAARLARMAVTGEAPETVCLPAERSETVNPDAALRDAYAERVKIYRALYPAVKAMSGRA